MRFLVLLALTACLQAAPVKPGPAPWAVTPEAAVMATYKVVVTAEYTPYQQLPHNVQWSGTAWSVRKRGTATQLITAGHVCEGDEQLKVLHVHLVPREGEAFPARVVRYSGTEPDLCLLETDHPVGSPLPIAPMDPVWGSPLAYVGAPLGYWAEGYGPIYYGHFAGHDMVTAPVAPGASGSAVWGASGVIGVVVRVRMDFPMAAFIVTRPELVKFLNLP